MSLICNIKSMETANITTRKRDKWIVLSLYNGRLFSNRNNYSHILQSVYLDKFFCVGRKSNPWWSRSLETHQYVEVSGTEGQCCRGCMVALMSNGCLYHGCERVSRPFIRQNLSSVFTKHVYLLHANNTMNNKIILF